MKKILSAAAMAAACAAAIAVTSGALAGPAPTAAKSHPFFANAHWDDDWEDRRRYGPMPVPNIDAIKRAGIVHVVEIERDDGLIEVEGYDADGRKIELVMDRQGQRVLSVKRDRHRHHH
jgi:hypothetical protein